MTDRTYEATRTEFPDKHGPGDWRYAPIESMSRDVEVWTAGGEALWSMHVWGDPDMEYVTEAGRLTAAAPDMRLALRAALAELRWWHHAPGATVPPADVDAMALAEAALLKSEGVGYCDECGRKLGDEYCCRTEEVVFDA